MKKTLLVGAGAIGGTVAVLGKEAGYDISLLCHGEQTKKTIENEGFFLHGAKGEHKAFFECFASPEELGDEKFDIVIIATKFQTVPEIAEKLLKNLREDSLVVGMQNGILTDRLAQVVGKERAVGVMIGFGATKNAANDVTMTSLGEMYVGMTDGYHPGNLDYLKELFSVVLPTEISDNILRQQYSKLIINSCINATAAITGLTLGKMVDDRRARTLYLAIAREAMRVAKKMGLNVPKYGKMLNYKMLMLADNSVYNACCRYVVWLVSKLKYSSVKPSTLQSLEKGETTEIEIFNGYIAKLGNDFGIETPVNTKLTAMIHEIERGERKITPDNLEEFRGMLF